MTFDQHDMTLGVSGKRDSGDWKLLLDYIMDFSLLKFRVETNLEFFSCCERCHWLKSGLLCIKC